MIQVLKIFVNYKQIGFSNSFINTTNISNHGIYKDHNIEMTIKEERP